MSAHSTPDRPDIGTEDHIRTLVYSFYERVGQDTLLGPIFNEVARIDWPTHLPLMVDFWCSVLFGVARYKGRPFPKHAVLPISKEHFNRWLSLFSETVDAHFAGPKAEEAKSKALSIATMFKHRMSLELISLL